jgi:quercetin dioxygenase-like cupin family protein
MLRRTQAFHCLCALALGIAATGTYAQDKSDQKAALSAMTPGLSAAQVAQIPGVLFARELTDVPGKNLVVVSLKFQPRPAQPPSDSPPKCRGHRHPGSTYVYVTQGTLRLGIEGQPVQTVHAGESFFEPPQALHNVAENASTTEPAAAIAVLIVPAGAPILVPEKCGAP